MTINCHWLTCLKWTPSKLVASATSFDNKYGILIMCCMYHAPLFVCLLSPTTLNGSVLLLLLCEKERNCSPLILHHALFHLLNHIFYCLKSCKLFLFWESPLTIWLALFCTFSSTTISLLRYVSRSVHNVPNVKGNGSSLILPYNRLDCGHPLSSSQIYSSCSSPIE